MYATGELVRSSIAAMTIPWHRSNGAAPQDEVIYTIGFGWFWHLCILALNYMYVIQDRLVA